MRDKVTILFNKNHIRLIKTEFGNNTGSYYWKTSDIQSDNIKHLYPWEIERPQNVQKWVRKESPLGFWYNAYETINTDSKDVKKIGYIRSILRNYIFMVGSVKYELSFLIEHNEKIVDNEVRPWELNDKPMQEHFIFDLFNELNPILKQIANTNYKYDEYPGQCGLSYAVEGDWDVYKHFFTEECRRSLIKKIFGDERGPVMQTNDEKILAAGFDLKTSFRKDKETK